MFMQESVTLVALVTIYFSMVSGQRACEAEVFATHGNGNTRLTKLSVLKPEETATKNDVIEVFLNEKKQSIFGFGAALSNAAAYLIHNSPQKHKIIRRLFSPTYGVGLSVLRLVMGGSDFQAVPPYTYDDIDPNKEDLNMEKFSIANDHEFIIPVIKAIKKINPKLKIVGTPWSAPAWMKLNKSLYGGAINDSSAVLEAYANYFVKFIRAYEKEGIKIDAISIQNEPEHATPGYPTMSMAWWQMSNLIKYHLGPKLEANKIKTEIWVFDHNWDMLWYPLALLNDEKVRSYVSGAAFHCYGGNPEDIQKVHDAFPDVDLHFTECSGGSWGGSFGGDLWWGFVNLFSGQLRHWSRSVMWWNIALDQWNGPRVEVDGCHGCRGVITVDTKNDTFSVNREFYSLAHFSKFVQPGAIHVDSTPNDVARDLHNVAFRDDVKGQTTVVVGNGWKDGWKTVSVKVGDQYFNYDKQIRHAELLTFAIKDTC